MPEGTMRRKTGYFAQKSDFTKNRDINIPWYMEADTVAHCGGSMAGEFIWNLMQNNIFFDINFLLIIKKDAINRVPTISRAG